jgi:hypothetical protein
MSACVLARSSALADLEFPSLAALVRWIAATEAGSFHVIPGAWSRTDLPPGTVLSVRRSDRSLIGRVFLEHRQAEASVPDLAIRLREMLHNARLSLGSSPDGSSPANAVRHGSDRQPKASAGATQETTKDTIDA